MIPGNVSAGRLLSLLENYSVLQAPPAPGTESQPLLPEWGRHGTVDRRRDSAVTSAVILKPPAAAPIIGKDALQQALTNFLKDHSEAVDYEVQEDAERVLSFQVLMAHRDIVTSGIGTRQ